MILFDEYPAQQLSAGSFVQLLLFMKGWLLYVTFVAHGGANLSRDSMDWGSYFKLGKAIERFQFMIYIFEK